MFILPSFPHLPLDEKLNTMCHELSHRVLGTVDRFGEHPNYVWIYGKTKALHLSASRSIRCAENWGYFYMELAKEMGLLH
jgi:hypothetical protein